MNGAVWLLSLVASALAVALAVLASLLWKLRAGSRTDAEERDRLIGELAQEKRLAAVRSDEAQRRLADKDAECARILGEKDLSCRRLVDALESSCSERLEEKDKACRQIIAEKNAEIENFLREKERAFAKTVDTLREQFANLASQQLKLHSSDLSELNKNQLEAVLKPLREQMRHLQEAAQKAEGDRENLRQSFARNVGAIETIATGLAQTATALSSNTSVQGRRGEDILAEKLRQAGLEENVSFFLQDGTDRDRPDAQICDSENRWLVIDSKVSLTAYLEYAALPEGAEKKSRLAAHIASVRQKIDQLAKKKYPIQLGKEFPERDYLPVTAMFVPYEAPLLEALKADPSLWQFAMQNNVAIITPLTLIAYLRLVYLAWQHEKEARNRDAIVDTARELLSRMNGFLVTFEKLGKSIESLQDAYSSAKVLLVDSPRAHSIAKAASRLIDLHVRLENRKGVRIAKADCLA